MLSAAELKDRLGDPDVIILDVRYGNDWYGAQEKIPGALRADPRKYKEWVGIFPKSKTIVVYCA
jgi:rhodanese-related sulfurtransferase